MQEAKECGEMAINSWHSGATPDIYKKKQNMGIIVNFIIVDKII